MAIDTAVKRNAALNRGVVFPDGTIGTIDRANLVGHYFTPPAPPPAPPAPADPSTFVAARLYTLYRTSEAYPSPSLTDGVPDVDTWFPTITRTAIGRLQVVVGGEDVTFLRNKLTIVERWQKSDPFGDRSAQIRFPQVTDFDAIGTGDLAMFAADPDIEIYLLNAAGTTVTATIFEGLCGAWEFQDHQLVIPVTGCTYQLDLYVRAPALAGVPIDLGEIIPFQYNTRLAIRNRNNAMPVWTTGLTTRDRGAWDDGVQTGYVQRLLESRGVKNDGTALTVNLVRPRTPTLAWRDLASTDWHVSNGGRGVECDLQREKTMSANVFYAEGEDEAGTRWRNSFPGADGVSVFFQPLSYDPDVHPYDDAGDGTLDTSSSGRVDDSLLRIEQYANLGTGIDKGQAKNILDGLRARLDDPGWVGTITLTADPEEGWRGLIEAGENIFVRYFNGAGLLLHIADVEVANPGTECTVTLKVDSKGRSADQLQGIIDRLAAAGKDPVKRLVVGRESSLNKDSTAQWDGGAGSGWIPRIRFIDGTSTVSVPQQTWTVVKFLAGEEISITKTLFVATAGALFHVSISDRAPTGVDAAVDYFTGPLTDYPSLPFAVGAWDGDKPAGQLIGWGSNGQAAGFSPGTETNPFAGASGVLLDEGLWTLSHKEVEDAEKMPMFAWAVFWCENQAMNIWGKLYRAGDGFAEAST